MFGKCFGLLAATLVLASQTASYGGWCGSSRHCYVRPHCHVTHHCCRPCPPCPPVHCGCDCIYNATGRVLSVSVTHGGGTESRACLKPGYWFKFSFDPSRHKEATVVAHDRNTNDVIVNQTFGLVNHPPAPYGCIHIVEPPYAAGATGSGGATLQRGGAGGPGGGTP